MSQLLCLGHGYSARAVTSALAQAPDWTITGTSRSVEGAARLAAGGRIKGLVYDGYGASTELAGRLRESTHLLVSAAPDDNGDPLLRHHLNDVLESPMLEWVGYLSTVGVYGDHAGDWVDEAAELKPSSQRSKRRVEAERAWLAIPDEQPHIKVQVFRLSGIYGPGRSAIDNVVKGTARRIIKPGQVFNRIHVEDIASAVIAGLNGAGRHSLYNVTDDEPAPPQDVVAYAAELLGRDIPPDIAFEDAELSPMGRSFYAELKRVSNARMKGDLGVALRYPTYREGLKAIKEALGL